MQASCLTKQCLYSRLNFGLSLEHRHRRFQSVSFFTLFRLLRYHLHYSITGYFKAVVVLNSFRRSDHSLLQLVIVQHFENAVSQFVRVEVEHVDFVTVP